mmetsp:Transcript_3131/g.5594  ORF Transcript_3131/g.5594 Transcript_3131/m.5594 type:complete len:80 (-) Transcript_3131:116-355(-)
MRTTNGCYSSLVQLSTNMSFDAGLANVQGMLALVFARHEEVTICPCFQANLAFLCGSKQTTVSKSAALAAVGATATATK